MADSRVREQGVVKWFNDQKGFGFIGRDGKKDVFVHHTGLENLESLVEGERVSFVVVPGQKGEKAIQVRREP